MEPDHMTAVPPGVAEDVLADPARFLSEARAAAPGWSTRYGGAEGVAQLTTVLDEHLRQLRSHNSDLRAAAVQRLRSDNSVGAIARLLDITRTSVQYIVRRAAAPEDPEAFARLEDPEAWRP